MGEDDIVAHAQLSFGHGMVMRGPVDDGSAHRKLMTQPHEIGMRETQSACRAVRDADVV
jgi:hypothetical protein